MVNTERIKAAMERRQGFPIIRHPKPPQADEQREKIAEKDAAKTRKECSRPPPSVHSQ